MKYCAVICEYNPFHNGHKYQLDRIRKESGCDAVYLGSRQFSARAFADCDQQDVPDFHSAMGELDAQLSLLAETQMISIKNIL